MEDYKSHSKQLPKKCRNKTENHKYSKKCTHHRRPKQTKHKQTPPKWAVFTYHSPRIRNLTNLFKHTDIGITFNSTNTTQLTKPKQKKNAHTNTTKVEFMNFTDLNHTTQTLKCTYDCNYSLIVLLMMGSKGARNM
jgi:hypothetical protein